MDKKQFKGVINLDVRDSKPDWEPYTPTKAPEGAPNILFSCTMIPVLRPGRHLAAGSICRRWTSWLIVA